MKSLIIGSMPDCDLVVNLPSVSGHHCRLNQDETGYTLEDLNSTNGTYFDGERIVGRVRIPITPKDTIHLGSCPLSCERVLTLFAQASAAMISLRGEEMVIGRGFVCDQIVDLPMISSRHARLFRAGEQVFIEDLKSSNGTFVNGNRVQTPVEVKAGDTVGLGSYTFVLDPGSWQLSSSAHVEPVGLSAETSLVPVEPETQGATALSGPDAKSGIDRILGDPWTLAALLLQAPLAALLIVGVLRQSSPGLSLFWLGLAVIWFGLSDAILGGLIQLPRPGSGLTLSGGQALGFRCLALVALCVLQCALAWSILAGAAALKAPWVPTLAFLILSSFVGLAFGLLVRSLAPRPAVAWTILPVAFLVLWLLGGQWRTVPEMFPGAGIATSAFPSRWTFEGLLLLESDEAAGLDLAEPYFPADSQRMGLGADTMALVFMLIGLAGAAAFISFSKQSGP